MADAVAAPNRGTPAERGTLNLATQALEFVLGKSKCSRDAAWLYSRLVRGAVAYGSLILTLYRRNAFAGCWQRAWSLEKQPCDFLPVDDERMMSTT